MIGHAHPRRQLTFAPQMLQHLQRIAVAVHVHEAGEPVPCAVLQTAFHCGQIGQQIVRRGWRHRLFTRGDACHDAMFARQTQDRGFGLELAQLARGDPVLHHDLIARPH